MAVDFGDHASGFRHIEVIRFINNEVLMNGGGPDFYQDFRSRPWTEIEDRLRAVVVNPEVPRTLKRACAWSALALSVRVGARQREQQACRIRQLQQQVDECKETSWALATELQWLRDERQAMAAQLHFMSATLQRVLNERDILYGQLLQAQSSAQVTTLAGDTEPGPSAEQLEASAWPQNEEQQHDRLPMGIHLQAPAPTVAPPAMFYMPGPPVPWAQAMPPLLPVPVPYLFRPRFPMESPSLQPVPPPLPPPLPPPPISTDTEAPVAPFLIPPPGIYPPVPWGAAGFQNDMAPLGGQSSYHQEGGPNILQDTAPLRDISSNSQENLEGPQGMVIPGNTICHSQAESSDSSWRPALMWVSKSHNQAEGPEKAQGGDPLGDSGRYNQEEDPERPQGLFLLGGSKSQRQEEDLVRPQETVPLGGSRSQNLKEGSQRPPQVASLGHGESYAGEKAPQKFQATLQGVRENTKEQQAQGEKAKQPEGEKSSDSQPDERSASGCNPVDWSCPWCKVLNFPWRKTCYRCKKVYTAAAESGDPESGQALGLDEGGESWMAGADWLTPWRSQSHKEFF
ncbi:testis-expressed protein 13D [Talpa occidentalis]|uniref:testis-expressed protein 13D n=1 Tax=Talpa occidentalis TaxID=50954 RepID=UPI00188FDF10|nr:testis-expressed protein 13D [Talpa occidentalis]